MPHPLRLSDLSPARQALVRLCQSINRGSIEALKVHLAEPMFDPFPILVKDVMLGKDEEERPELALSDFALSSEVLRLLRLLDEMKGGTIRLIEVRDGIPRRMLLASQGPVVDRAQRGRPK
jgi:hypothetical protein